MNTIRKPLVTLAILVAVTLVAMAGFVWSGLYNVAADEHHLRATHALLEAVRTRSISRRAGDLEVPPDLDDEARIRQGAGNYNAMCMGCHLAPGMGDTELSRGLYPAPPKLSQRTVQAAEAFWVIKHGIKASGMPAWGGSMDDVYIWNMAAFLQALPNLTPAQYQALVDSSGGHEHGGGETEPHDHGASAGDDHHAPSVGRDAVTERPAAGSGPAAAGAGHAHPPGTAAPDDAPPAKRMTTHRHADGTVESHPVERTTKADDGHDHEH
jgi:mono/diheme cytochrome c family protein